MRTTLVKLPAEHTVITHHTYNGIYLWHQRNIFKTSVLGESSEAGLSVIETESISTQSSPKWDKDLGTSADRTVAKEERRFEHYSLAQCSGVCRCWLTNGVKAPFGIWKKPFAPLDNHQSGHKRTDPDQDYLIRHGRIKSSNFPSPATILRATNLDNFYLGKQIGAQIYMFDPWNFQEGLKASQLILLRATASQISRQSWCNWTNGLTK